MAEKWYSMNIGIKFIESQNVEELKRIGNTVAEIFEAMIMKSDLKTCSSYDELKFTIEEVKE